MSAVAPVLSSPRIPSRALPVATALLLIVVGLAITVRIPTGTPAMALLITGVLVLSSWMLISRRYELTLAVLMLYVGLADGYLKLKTGSDYATIARDVLLYAIAGGALVRASVRGARIELPPLTGWVVAWLIVVAVQVFNPANGTLVHSIASVRPHVEWVPLFFLGYLVLRSKKRLRAFLLLLLLVTAINGVVGLAQFNLTPDQLAGWGPGYEEKIAGVEDVSGRAFVDDEGTVRTRPFALGADMGFGGILGLLAVPAALALLSVSQLPPIRAGTLLLAAGCVMAIATSQARVAVIGAILAAFAFAALTASSRAGLRTVLGIGLAMLLAYGTATVLSSDSEDGSFDRYSDISTPVQALETTYDYRKDTISQVPTYVMDFPLGAGIGSKGPGASFGGGGDEAVGLNAESQPTFLLIELGVPGLIVLLGFNIKLFVLSIKRIRRIHDRELRILLTGLVAPLFALFAAWIVGVSSATTPTAPYFWLTAGVLAYWLVGDGWSQATNRAGKTSAPGARAGLSRPLPEP